jgi:uncharacterized membrane protein (UPF0127 family)
MTTETDTTVLTGPFEQARGVIAREPTGDERYVFKFDSTKERTVHMLGVRSPLLVRWLVDDELTHEQVLQPWTGHASARANTIVEMGVSA